jgi:nucleolar protein 12
MAKSKDKRPAKTEPPKKSDKSPKSLIKVDKKAFDPTLASLFASSVRFPLRRSIEV